MKEEPKMPEPKAKGDPYDHDSDMPEYADTTGYPEIPESYKEYDNWPTTGMARPIAEEHWDSKMTRLEDNNSSIMLHDQMTSEEVQEWLQEPSDQVMGDRYNRPDQEDNQKHQKLCCMRLRENYWTGDLGPDL